MTLNNLVKQQAVLALLCTFLFLSAARSDEPSGMRSVHLRGASSLVPVARIVAENYMTEYPGLIVTVEEGGTRRGIKGVLDGSVDIGMASSNNFKEMTGVLLHERELECRIVGRGAVIPFVHPSNQVSGISINDLRKILTGEISNWKYLNGRDAPITVCSYNSSSGDRAVLKTLIMEDHIITPNAIILDSHTMKQYVASHPNALGYAGIPFIDKTIKPLSVNGVYASSKTIKDKSYPLARDLIFYMRKDCPDEVRKFVDYFLNPSKGQKIVRQSGDVPVAE
ncbi:MAG: phosphate ABC transporter substrate-binding protein [Elusimicrobia bacterium]|nr:phosphate ABC transporter substrate-binding protein [Candidatus Obscuribacterium magneticum]